MNLEEELVRHNLSLHPMGQLWFCRKRPENVNSPLGKGPTPSAAVEDFIHQLTNSPEEFWTYNHKEIEARSLRRLAKPTVQISLDDLIPKPSLSLEDLGL